jgi:hypothetical protein
LFKTDRDGRKWIEDRGYWCKKCASVHAPSGQCEAFRGEYCKNMITCVMSNSESGETRWACHECAESKRARLAGFDGIAE